MREEAAEQRIEVFIPSPVYCTDNAAMVGVIGYEYLKRGVRSPQALNAFSSLPF
jgi:N6-L-threonylcarbamoyladenine synthase